MKILAIDSATAACSAAVWADGTVLAEEAVEMARGHAEALLPMIDRVRRAAGIAFADLDRLAVTVGPGHFTGLRIGLAAARGLALATGLPLVGVTTLEAVAAAVPTGERRSGLDVLAALDSKRAEAYVQMFDARLKPAGAPASLLPAEAAAQFAPGRTALLVVGDAAEPLATEIRGRGVAVRVLADIRHPRAASVAALAATAPLPDGFPAPLYLHPVEITTPKARSGHP